MFKALDKWMEELEAELLDSYQRANKAGTDWLTAVHNMHRSADIEFYKIRDSLRANYQGYCICKLGSDYREEHIGDIHGNNYYALIQQLELDGKKYDYIIAFGRAKDSCTEQISSMQSRALKDRFKEHLDSRSGMIQFFRDRNVHESHVTLVNGRTDEWIANRAHKDMIAKKKAIEAKVAKICGEVVDVNDQGCDIYVKGSNDRIAHLWRILAGGYNIQCLHTRVLCKEVK